MSHNSPLLTVIIPTIGRFTLEDTLRSIAEQPESKNIEVLIVADIHGYRVRPTRYRGLDNQFYDYRWLEYDAGFNCWGHPQRNYAMPHASGRYIVSLDDDDTWDSGAFEAISRACARDVERRFHVFKMRYQSGDELWRWPTVMFGNIGTPMVVFPNDPNLYGTWGRAYEGDFFFIQTTLANMGVGSLVWHDAVIAHIRPAAVEALA